MYLKNGNVQVERIPKFCEPIQHIEWTPPDDKNYRWPCLCINCRSQRDKDPEAFYASLRDMDITYELNKLTIERKVRLNIIDNNVRKKPGPVPEFPKYKLITFTVNDDNLKTKVMIMKSKVQECLNKFFVPEWYIGVVEYGEKTERIHVHVLACFGSSCSINKELSYSKFNSRFKTRYLKVYKLGNIDIKDVNLRKNPESLRDISLYFSKDPNRQLFFSGIESEKNFYNLLKESQNGQEESSSKS